MQKTHLQNKIELGSLYWLATDSEIAHPHVVIAIDSQSKTATVCSITTNMKKLTMPGNVVLDIGEGNLEKQSIVEVAKRTEVKSSELVKYIGRLNQKRIDAIIDGIGFINRTFLNSSPLL